MDWPPSGTRSATRTATHPAPGEGLWDWNLTSNRIHFSPGWISLVGCQDHEIGNTPDEWFQRVHPDDSARLLREIEAARADGAHEFDLRYRLRHKTGSYRWMCSRGLVLRNDRGDATRLTGAQTDVTVDTVTDPLTGLPNRLLLLDRLTQSITRARHHSTFHFALLLIDIGRPLGPTPASPAATDPLLNGAARRVETCLRLPEGLSEQRQHDVVARADGDRLAVLLDGLSDLHHATVVADHLLAALLNPFSLSGREVRLSPSIGIAVSATGYTHADHPLRDAETALHRARVLGGAHYEVFDADVLKSERSARQLEDDLEVALQRGEFELVYQPIVSLASSNVVGFEALVRWRHETRGVISPLDFIPMAERTGLIVPLGEWIVHEACRQLRDWQTSIPTAGDLWVSVNVSGVELRDSGLAEHIAEALHRSELPASRLVLELTEGVAMDNPVAVTTVLMRLRAMGVRISIDDFGTGYSSLAYLRQFPVDGLKLDQSFVRGLANSKDTVAIVTSIVSMAKELGLHVVAEGVETHAQASVLQSLHVESAQGYLFATPLDAKSAGDFLRTGPVIRLLSESLIADAGSATPDDDVQPWYRNAWPRSGRDLLVAGVVLVALASAGVGALLPAPNQTRAAAGPPQGPHDSASSGGKAGGLTGELAKEPAGPKRPEVHAAAVHTDTLTPATAATMKTAAPATATPAAATPAAATPAVAAAPATKSSAQTSFDVVHLHRIGKCTGQLVVSRTGVAFVPEKTPDGDAVTLKYDQFVHALNEDTLTIKSADHTYRFTVPPGSPMKLAATQKIADAIVRSRPK